MSIVSDLGVPVKLIGVGESLYDLRDFEPVLFVDSLLGYSVRRRVMVLGKRFGLRLGLRGGLVFRLDVECGMLSGWCIEALFLVFLPGDANVGGDPVEPSSVGFAVHSRQPPRYFVSQVSVGAILISGATVTVSRGG